MSKIEKKPRGGAREGSGRKPGSPNRRSWNMRHELDAAGFEPLSEMLVILRGTADADKKWERLAWLCRHLYPTLKEVEQVPDMPEDEVDHLSERSTEDLLLVVEKA